MSVDKLKLVEVLETLKNEYGFITMEEHNKVREEMDTDEYANFIYKKFGISKITLEDMKAMGMSKKEIIAQIAKGESIFAKNMIRDIKIRSGEYERELDVRYLNDYANSMRDIIGENSYNKLLAIDDKNYMVELLKNYATRYALEKYENDNDLENEVRENVAAALKFYELQKLLRG